MALGLLVQREVNSGKLTDFRVFSHRIIIQIEAFICLERFSWLVVIIEMPPKSGKARGRGQNSRGRGRGASRRADDATSDIEEDMPPSLPPRPFTEMEGLPVSVEGPEYNLLNDALSLKDSAVLYSSLMKSRKAYTNGNLFELYWSKARNRPDNETSARDKMNKLCDCSLEAGPHSFDVRFFILKDDEIERKREEDKNLKKEKRLANKKLKEEKQRARELKLQNKPLINDPNSASSFSPVDVNSTSQVKQEDKENNDANDDNESDSDDSNDENQSLVQTREATPQATPPHLQEEKEKQGSQTISQEKQEPDSKEEPAKEEKKEDLKKPLPPLQVQRSVSPSKHTTEVQPSSAAIQPPPKAAAPKHKPSDPMQTPESQMMIANLNAIARVDPSLNALMKIVATGSAKPEQIREFQGYIQRAKAMGPSPTFRQNFPSYGTGTSTTVKQKTGSTSTPQPPAPPKVKKVKPPKEKQLTTFQELYVNGADLVFEFHENANVRYHLPKNCIVEKVGDGEFLISFLVVHNQEEINKFLERKRVRLEKQANKEKSISEKEEKENEAMVKQEESGSKENNRRSTRRSKSDDYEKTGKEVPVETKPNTVASSKDEPKEPIPYFTSMTFKLKGIAERYDPIFINSFNKYDDVKAKMEHVLKEGVRVSKYFIWYSVDAYKDESLAENLRNELYLVENPPKGKYKKRGRPATEDAVNTKRAKV